MFPFSSEKFSLNHQKSHYAVISIIYIRIRPIITTTFTKKNPLPCRILPTIIWLQQQAVSLRIFLLFKLSCLFHLPPCQNIQRSSAIIMPIDCLFRIHQSVLPPVLVLYHLHLPPLFFSFPDSAGPLTLNFSTYYVQLQTCSVFPSFRSNE